MEIRTKIILVAVLPVLMLALISMAVFLRNSGRVTSQVEGNIDKLVRKEVASIVQDVYRMCEMQDVGTRYKLQGDIKIARRILLSVGAPGYSPVQTVEWQATNQLTGQKDLLKLPAFFAGTTWLGNNADPKVTSPVVDEVRTITGSTCTIFQRMNERGDMLRVSTNVMKADGTRAIGTYIPPLLPDGTPNPIIKTILRGENYLGKAFVVDAWYMTAYEPLKDAAGAVIGMAYVGVKLDYSGALHKAVLASKVGKTGYVYVLSGSGQDRGKYVISYKGARDGENVWQTTDANGNLVIQKIIRTAMATPADGYDFVIYPWKNAGETRARDKIAAVAYYAPWDWVIGAGAYLDEFMDEKTQIQEELAIMIYWVIGSILVFLSLATLVGVLIARSISLPLMQIIDRLGESASQTTSAAGQISATSQNLADGATRQAASLEETSSALEQMSSMTRQNADNANTANQNMQDTQKRVTRGAEAVSRMAGAMSEISESSDRIGRIIKTIEEIAFQTNLLALNAAVEAARAGDAGKGFAVVADEVRNLAQRSAQAARDTAELIQGTVTRVEHGEHIAEELQQSFREIEAGANQATRLMGEITTACNEQAQGVEQVNIAVGQMDKITQENAANAEESASAAEQLSAQADQLNAMVRQLLQLASGKDADPNPAFAHRNMMRPALPAPRE